MNHARPRPTPVLAAVALTASLAGCVSAADAATGPTSTSPLETEAAQEHAEFAYTGDEGPSHWGELDEAFATCADGSAQSPIDLAGATGTRLPDPTFAYLPGQVTLTDTGHTVQADVLPGSTLVLDGVTYDLVQLHLHERAEHTVDGLQADAELHLVHKDAEGHVAVVGVLLTVGAESSALAPYFDSLPSQVGDTTTAADLDLAAILPEDLSTFRYDGSLTTPPCTEGVEWVVLATPVEVSPDQLIAFRAVVPANNRPVQQRDGRELVLDSADA